MLRVLQAYRPLSFIFNSRRKIFQSCSINQNCHHIHVAVHYICFSDRYKSVNNKFNIVNFRTLIHRHSYYLDIILQLTVPVSWNVTAIFWFFNSFNKHHNTVYFVQCGQIYLTRVHDSDIADFIVYSTSVWLFVHSFCHLNDLF